MNKNTIDSKNIAVKKESQRIMIGFAVGTLLLVGVGMIITAAARLLDSIDSLQETKQNLYFYAFVKKLGRYQTLKRIFKISPFSTI